MNYYLDSFKTEGFKGYSLFSKPLSNSEITYLCEFSSQQKAINSKVAVWAYNAKTLTLIKGSPFISMQKLAEYFDVSYRTIGSHLDTEISTNLNGQLVYLFSKEISVELKNELVNNLTKANNATTEVWVYKGKR